MRPEQKMCRTKKRYPAEAEAIKAALGSSKTFAKPMRWYRCPVCQKWHVTSSVR